ncbi:wall-associated receptor kinase 3-like [Solanum tuberosum]|uniref:wall-associated receptor kinase 3-like n=1 Tax=Solanum tuberosum TaxID=4113 RepID=UPI00073A1F63|nr:PREDICTED: wall-associated receptor kinase 3-like [Solanum tuberosum]
MDPNFVDRIVNDVPIVIDWVIGTKNCSVVRNSTTYSCMEHSLCIDSESRRGGYRCICEEGYDGNPYLSPGCQDIDECATRPWDGICKNTPGGFECSCPKGYFGDGKKGRGCQKEHDFPILKLSLGLGLGLLSILQMSSNLNKVFTTEELEKTTNNFSKDGILGVGGNGVVYKGVLPDQRLLYLSYIEIKSANILLDDYYTTKIVDFGASRLRPFDQADMSSLIIPGYLHPKAIQMGLSDKNDVYSFGVVLAELLTG